MAANVEGLAQGAAPTRLFMISTPDSSLSIACKYFFCCGTTFTNAFVILEEVF